MKRLIKNPEFHSTIKTQNVLGSIWNECGFFKSKIKNQTYFLIIPNITKLHNGYITSYKLSNTKIFNHKLFKRCDIVDFTRNKKNSCGTTDNPYFGYYCIVEEEDLLEFLLEFFLED